jgi:hypothetical protein
LQKQEINFGTPMKRARDLKVYTEIADYLMLPLIRPFWKAPPGIPFAGGLPA